MRRRRGTAAAGDAVGWGKRRARALAAKGVKVAIFDLQGERGETVAGEIGGVLCKVDVTSDESVDAGFEKARAAHGQERVLVCCAGTGNAIKTASRSKEDGSIKHFPIAASLRTRSPQTHCQVRNIGYRNVLSRSSTAPCSSSVDMAI